MEKASTPIVISLFTMVTGLMVCKMESDFGNIQTVHRIKANGKRAKNLDMANLPTLMDVYLSAIIKKTKNTALEPCIFLMTKKFREIGKKINVLNSKMNLHSQKWWMKRDGKYKIKYNNWRKNWKPQEIGVRKEYL